MMRGVVLLRPPEQRWECPNCTETAVVRDVIPEPGASTTRMHFCRGLRGIFAPMVPAGVKAKVEAVDRGDYVGDENVQTDGAGRPVMAVLTTREDGMDCTVLAPCAMGAADDYR